MRKTLKNWRTPERIFFCVRQKLQGISICPSRPVVFPNEAIEFLRACQFDPAAQLNYELLSGGIIWTDERYGEFSTLCLERGCSRYGMLFAYRTSLLRRTPLDEYRFAREEVRPRCPQ